MKNIRGVRFNWNEEAKALNENVDLEKAKYLCSLPLSLGKNPENDKDITVNVGRFGPYLKCENKVDTFWCTPPNRTLLQKVNFICSFLWHKKIA